jgi:hypothetical protein
MPKNEVFKFSPAHTSYHLAVGSEQAALKNKMAATRPSEHQEDDDAGNETTEAALPVAETHNAAHSSAEAAAAQVVVNMQRQRQQQQQELAQAEKKKLGSFTQKHSSRLPNVVSTRNFWGRFLV